MYPEQGLTVVRKRLSFLSVLTLCVTSVIVTVIVSAVGLGLYGICIVDSRADGLVDLVQGVVQSFPEIRENLPPLLSDAIHDQRDPDYLTDLDITVSRGHEDKWGRGSATVVVSNRGTEIVSFLTMRIVGFDGDSNLVFEQNAWAASPIQVDDDWRGPLLPGATRRFKVHHHSRHKIARLDHEITDVRTWTGPVELEAREDLAAAM